MTSVCRAVCGFFSRDRSSGARHSFGGIPSESGSQNQKAGCQISARSFSVVRVTFPQGGGCNWRRWLFREGLAGNNRGSMTCKRGCFVIPSAQGKFARLRLLDRIVSCCVCIKSPDSGRKSSCTSYSFLSSLLFFVLFLSSPLFYIRPLELYLS